MGRVQRWLGETRWLAGPCRVSMLCHAMIVSSFSEAKTVLVCAAVTAVLLGSGIFWDSAGTL